MWQNKFKNCGKDIAFPYFLYYDDMEVNNPLGIHCRPIGAFYVAFPSLDMSKLDHIYLVGFINACDLKKSGNDSCLYYLINQINALSRDGIEINVNGEIHQVYFSSYERFGRQFRFKSFTRFHGYIFSDIHL